jgi:hypothetical protein
MTSPANESFFLNRGCQPHQAAFAATFFSAAAPAIVPLWEPTESGRLFTAAEICGHALSSAQAKAILVVAATELGARHAKNMMESRSETGTVTLATRRRWWQLEANAAVGANPWPLPGIAVLAADTLKHGDFTDGLRLATWDMIVLHGIDHEADDRVRKLVKGSPKARVLCLLDEDAPRDLTATDMRAAPSTREKGDLTDEFSRIMRDYLTDSMAGIGYTPSLPGQSLLKVFYEALASDTSWTNVWKTKPTGANRLPAIRWVEYARTSDEIKFAEALRDHLRSLDESECRPRVVALARAASSSLYSLERMLFELRGTRNRIAHRLEPGLQGINATPPQLLQTVHALLPLIEQVPHDSKTAALRQLLTRTSERRDASAMAYVYVRFAATADYLCTTLEEAGLAVAALTDRMPYQEQKKAAADAENAHGVVVITPDAAVAMPRASTLILYDLPDSLFSWTTLAFSFSWANSGSSVNVISLTDTTGCLPHEAVERKAIQTGARATDDDILEAL